MSRGVLLGGVGIRHSRPFALYLAPVRLHVSGRVFIWATTEAIRAEVSRGAPRWCQVWTNGVRFVEADSPPVAQQSLSCSRVLTFGRETKKKRT
jgi:hypothetical protein